MRGVLTPAAAHNRRLAASAALRAQGQQHAQGQQPRTMLLACCDSRVLPQQFVGHSMGDVFVSRSIGNSIPVPAASGLTPAPSEVACALEYGVAVLGVDNLVICGHSNCGAIRLAVEGLSTADAAPQALPNLQRLAHGLAAPAVPASLYEEDATLSVLDQASQHNTVNQLAHARAYPCVRAAEGRGLQLHALWIDFNRGGAVLRFEPGMGRFVDVGSTAALLGTRVGAAYAESHT